MEPIFSLPYSEYSVADLLSKHFKSKDGYSVYLPMSRQAKGVDLMLCRRNNGVTTAMTVQVKASRTYTLEPPKRKGIKRYKYYTWFKRFEVTNMADYYFLFGLYPSEDSLTTKKNISRWLNFVLVFSYEEMKTFIDSVKNKKGLPDHSFSFAFDNPSIIKQARGDQYNNHDDYSKYLFSSRINKLRSYFSI